MFRVECTHIDIKGGGEKGTYKYVWMWLFILKNSHSIELPQELIEMICQMCIIKDSSIEYIPITINGNPFFEIHKLLNLNISPTNDNIDDILSVKIDPIIVGVTTDIVHKGDTQLKMLSSEHVNVGYYIEITDGTLRCDMGRILNITDNCLQMSEASRYNFKVPPYVQFTKYLIQDIHISSETKVRIATRGGGLVIPQEGIKCILIYQNNNTRKKGLNFEMEFMSY
jgi:hypothetical protein